MGANANGFQAVEGFGSKTSYPKKEKLPGFMQSNGQRGALGMLNEKSIKQNAFVNGYYIDQTKYLKEPQNVKLPNKYLHKNLLKVENRDKREMSRPSLSQCGVRGGGQQGKRTQTTFYKLLTENGFIKESMSNNQKREDRPWN